MIFKELQIKNFQLFGNEEATLDLSSNGLKLILGDNGVGKSTLGYAIVWCLYGKTLQDSVDDVVNRYTKKNCKVSVTFIQDGINYKIIRYRKHETHESNIYVFKGDKDISMKKATDTNQLILDIIQTPYQAFINSTFFSTELYSKFMKSKISERLSVFESLLSLKEVALFYDQAKNFHSEIVDKLEEIKLLKAVKTSEKETIERSINEYILKAKENITILKEEKTKTQKEFVDKKNSICEYVNIDIVQELKNIDNGKRVESIKQKIDKKKLEKKSIPEDVSEERKTFNEIKSNNINFDLEFSKEIKTIEINECISVLNLELVKLNSEIAKLDLNYSSKYEEIKNITIKNTELEKEELDLKDNVCSLCKQHIGDEFVTDRKNIISLLKKENIENIWKIEKERDLINRERELLKKDKENVEKNIIDNKTLMPSKNTFIKGTVKEVFDKYNSCENAINSYDKEFKNINESNILIDNELKELEKELIDLNFIPKYTEEFLLNIQDVIKKTEKEIENLVIKLSTIDGKASSLYDKKYVEHQKEIVSKVELVINDFSNKEEVFKEEDKYYLCLMDCFSNKENSFKKFFIGEMIETFNDKINQYLPFFFEENMVITFDKELNEVITMDGFEINYSSLSSGQKARTEMSVAFSLFNLSRVFFSSETNLLIIDEILDANVDQRGIESALTIVEGLSGETGIFVISHNQEMKDRIKNKIEIRKDENGFSVIK